MVYYRDYVAGWLDSSIHALLATFPPRSSSAAYTLITCLDSNVEPRALLNTSSELRAVADLATPLGKGILLPTKRLLAVMTQTQLFFGFDEIWFFPSKDIEPKPDAPSLVGPARLDQRRLETLGAWLAASSCSLALGDGAGLNFVLKAHGLARYVLGHSIEQPEPSVTPFEIAETA